MTFNFRTHAKTRYSVFCRRIKGLVWKKSFCDTRKHNKNMRHLGVICLTSKLRITSLLQPNSLCHSSEWISRASPAASLPSSEATFKLNAWPSQAEAPRRIIKRHRILWDSSHCSIHSLAAVLTALVIKSTRLWKDTGRMWRRGIRVFISPLQKWLSRESKRSWFMSPLLPLFFSLHSPIHRARAAQINAVSRAAADVRRYSHSQIFRVSSRVNSGL